MSLTRLAIERNRVTLVLLLVIVAAGLDAYRRMPQAEDPGFIIRTAMVLTYFPGASPERVEQLVTDKLEKAIQEMPELDTIKSQSKSGVSIITVDIDERYQDMRPIWDSLRRKIEGATPDLPNGIRGPFVNDEFGDVFGTVINLVGDGYTYAELEQVADETRDELLLIDDVAKVDLYGVQDERIFVEYSNARLAELGLSPRQLQQILESRNIINPGGDIRTEYEQIVLEPSGNYESVEDLGGTLVHLPGTGELVHLRDIAHIYRAYVDPPRAKVRTTEGSGLVLAVAMREGGNVVALGDELRQTIARLETLYPIGIEFDFVIEQAQAVRRKVDDFVSNLVQAVIIVLGVMLFSLGPRTGLVVATLIPMAIIMAFYFMPLVGVGIDQMSLAALIIALGLLVDNAIVVSESIMVQMAGGKSAKEAAIDSAAELKTPLLVSSLTTAAAFLPIFLAESTVGEYTGALFKVVTITLLCSWILSLTMIPLFCVLFLKIEKQQASSFDSRFYRLYRAFLLMLLRHPLASLIAVVGIFVASLQLFRFVPVIFFPDNDRPTLTAELRLPIGTPLARTEEMVIAIERYLNNTLRVTAEEAEAGQHGLVNWTAFIGEGAPRFYLSYGPEPASPEYAIFLLNATDRAFVDEAVARLREHCQLYPGLRATIEPLASGPPAGSPIEVRISGRESDEVFRLVGRVTDHLRQMIGPREITDDWGARSKKLLIKIDEDRAQRAGISNQDVALSLQTVFSGITSTEFREGDKVIPVTLRSSQAGDFDLRRIGSINVFSQTSGRSVPATQVADVEVVWQGANIRRRDRLKTVAVQADLEPGFTAKQVTQELLPWLEEESRDWPLGYSWEIGGEDEASNDANASIVEKLPIAGLLIVLLLVGQFNSLRRPLIILLTIPLGLIGVVIGLLVLRSYFGFMTFLGVVSLAGIVINNAIVLLDRIQIEQEQNGLTAQQAIVESAQRRLRPIVLTTFTTLGGMIPLYLDGGPMFESMAIAIMFGLVFATLLTLGVVPVLYALFFRVGFKGFAS